MRRTIAVALAYLLALQAGVAAYAVAPAGDRVVTCISVFGPVGREADRSLPADHAACAACALACSAFVPPTRRAGPAIALQLVAPMMWRPALAPPVSEIRSRSAPARAPPQARSS